MKKLKVLKDKISVKLMLLYATILSVMPFDVFAEDRNVNTKYFGNKQEFWGELKTWYLWFMGFLWFVTILMIFLAASKASAKVSIAKMSGNSSEYHRGLKNYAQFFINLAAGLAFITFLATIFGAYIFFKK